MKKAKSSKVLVSGASIAGPAIAYWLHRYGFNVTVIERAPTVREGGYPIDIRGSAIGVVERMGMLPALREAHIHTGALHFMDDDGNTLRTVKPEEVSGGTEGFDVEVPRWTLSKLFYDATKDNIEYRFNDSIESLDNNEKSVDVTFASGATEKFDIVIGADGLHSNTRRLAFGPEDEFLHYLGYTFAGFTMPNIINVEYGSAFYTNVGRMVALYGVKKSDTVHAFFNIVYDHPSPDELKSVEKQRQIMNEAFRGDGWVVPQVLEAFAKADDIYFDSVSQIRMKNWSKGRVVLLGDAAFAPSFLTGQGSSCAIVGAYVLAGELASHESHIDAFAGYERVARGFIERNQGNTKFRGSQFIPNNEKEAELFAERLGAIEFGASDEIAEQKRQVHNSIELPDYRAFEAA